jgi:hypothetical protein
MSLNVQVATYISHCNPADFLVQDIRVRGTFPGIEIRSFALSYICRNFTIGHVYLPHRLLCWYVQCLIDTQQSCD